MHPGHAISYFAVACSLFLSAAVIAGPATHGVAAGDVRDTSAVIWSRTDGAGTLHVRVEGRHDGRDELRVPVRAADDYTGKALVTGLKPDTEYRYTVRFTPGDARDAVAGRFRTAPSATQPKAVRFAWGGDLAGQNVCRDAAEGFPIMQTLAEMPLDFFVGLGDMIYADNTCEAVGRYGNAQVPGGYAPAADLPAFWAHWKYNREDAGLRRLLARVPYYAVWDDHEVINDFGPLHDTRANPPYTPGAHLLPLGLDAFFDYNPIAEDPATPKRLYRSVRWGKHVELFLLDTRQYRDANLAADSGERPKTMLGREQLVWLKQGLAASDATWKIIASSVPMSIPTGFPPENGRDGWADFDQDTGFEHELLGILRFMQQQRMRNSVWITTDVHFAEVFRYAPFADDPSFTVHEFVTGPLNAGLFPNRPFDETLNPERLFFYGPDAPVTTWGSAKPWMNFGLAQVDVDGRLTLSIRDVAGKSLYALALSPQ